MYKYLLFSSLLLWFAASIPAQNTQSPSPPSSLTLHFKVSTMTSASHPELWNDYFILSYYEQISPRFVMVAFEHENYQVLHRFLKNDHGVFVFYANVPDVAELRYRLNVDGVWQADPQNPNLTHDARGVSLSIFSLPSQRNLFASGPIYRGDGLVDFYLSTKPSASVFLVGDFTRWDPFLLPMQEVEPGLYHLRVYLRDGEHHYYFLVNGIRMTDPSNFLQKEFLGEAVSTWSTPAHSSEYRRR